MRPYLVAAAALIAFLALAIGNVLTTSPTTDEGVHLASGISYRTGDYRLNPEHPPLLKRFAALFVREPSFDGAMQARQKLDEAWAAATTDAMAEWTYSHYFFWGLRDSHFGAPTTELPPRDAWVSDAPAMFTRARLTMLACGAALALLVFLWSRTLWGAWGAALSVALFSFDPNFIAHSGLVTTDVGVSLFFFAAIFFLWRALGDRFRWQDLAAFAIAFGCAQASKFSAVLLVPIVAVIVIHALLLERRGLPRRGVTPAGQARPLQRIAILLVSAFIATFVIIWAAYGFHRGPDRPLRNVVEEWYATQQLAPLYPDGPPDLELRRARATTPIGFAGNLLLRAKEMDVLPESYLYGLATIRRSSILRDSFLNGEYSSTGFRSYFFWTFLYKTSIPALLAIVLALFAVRKTKTRALPFLLWPVVIYLAISIQSSLNIGHRHVLPVVPFLYVLAGSLATRWKERSVAVLIALLAVCSVVVILPKPAPLWGRHLSYMNELAGGPWRGYEKLLDSNFDWGQDLPRLAAWLREHHVNEPVNLVYSSMAEPRAFGIRYRNLAFGYWAEPALLPDQAQIPGYLAIDASRLEGLGIVAAERNTWKTFLAQHNAKEVGRAGYSILIYRLQ